MDADLDALERLHADDFQLINPGGSAVTKAEHCGGIASGEIGYVVWEPASEIAVRLYGEAVAVRYQADAEIVVGGERIVVRTWHTDVYEHRGGRWQVVWSQATAVQKPRVAGRGLDRVAPASHWSAADDGRERAPGARGPACC